MEEQNTSAVDAFMAATADVPSTLGAPPAPVTASSPATVAVADSGFQISAEMVGTVIAMPFEIMALNTGKGGEFWHLSEVEKDGLGKAWLPVVNKLLAMWGLSEHGPLTLAVLLTTASLVPRLAQEKTRRASLTATTQTARYGASPTSQAQPAPENLESLIDSLAVPAAA